MKLEVGKYYKTRGGRKARVICTNRNDSHPVVILIENPDNQSEALYALNESGKPYNYCNTVNDLVSEWIDKPEFDWSKAAAWHVAIARAADGKWYSYGKVPSFIASKCFFTGLGILIPDEYAPVWEGDTRDSLIIRPGYEVIS